MTDYRRHARDETVNLPAHYAIEGICAACRGAIKSGDDRYRIGERDYHAHCFDISLVGPMPLPQRPL